MFFHFGHVSLYPNFGCLPVFVSVVLSKSAMSPVLAEWPYIVGVLLGPVTQSPCLPELGAPGVSTCGLGVPSCCS